MLYWLIQIKLYNKVLKSLVIFFLLRVLGKRLVEIASICMEIHWFSDVLMSFMSEYKYSKWKISNEYYSVKAYNNLKLHSLCQKWAEVSCLFPTMMFICFFFCCLESFYIYFILMKMCIPFRISSIHACHNKMYRIDFCWCFCCCYSTAICHIMVCAYFCFWNLIRIRTLARENFPFPSSEFKIFNFNTSLRFH